MSWQVSFAPEVEEDVAHAAEWYEQRREGLGAEFVEEVIVVWQSLAENPFLNSRRHPAKQIRVAAVLHAAMDEHHWFDRV